MHMESRLCWQTLSKSLRKPPEVIQTTLYDLIVVMQNGVGPEDDTLIVDTLTKLIRTGHIHFLRETKAKRPEC